MDPVSNIERETHQRVLELLARGQADQDALGARLSPEERAARGELHDWSPKDHVAHNNFWRQDAIWRLPASLEGGTPPDTEDDQAWNDRVFQEQRAAPWEQLVMETKRLRAETAALIQQISSDDPQPVLGSSHAPDLPRKAGPEHRIRQVRYLAHSG